MTIIWKDPNIRLHGKRHKCDRYYFRWHYGKQRVVQVVAEYVDKPTERQKSAREAFTELRREVARQLHAPTLRARWEARFKKDPQGYKMLHTYVYAKLKAGEAVACRDELLCVSPNVPQEYHQQTYNILPMLGNKGDAQKGVSTNIVARGGRPNIALLVVDGGITPLFLPSQVPKTKHMHIKQTRDAIASLACCVA